MRLRDLSVAATFARRELRGGLKGFRVFLACLALGVGAIAAVGSVRSAIFEGLRTEGAAILGGDAELKFTYRSAEGAELDWVGQVATGHSEIVEFRSMASTAGGADGQQERSLVQVKGVDGVYPIYGEVRLQPDLPLADALGPGPDGVHGAVMEPVLIDRLGLSVGDRVRLGTGELELRAALTHEPDKISGGFAFGPRVLVSLDGLEGTGLLQPGSFYETLYRLRLPEGANLNALKEDALERFADQGVRWRDSRNGAPGVERFVQRIGSFLVLVGLAALAVGGVGVAAAVRSYLEGKTETIATLKTLGATGRVVAATYLMQIGALTVLGIALGIALGAGAPALLGPLFADNLPVPALFDVYTRPLAEAALYGALTALLFALWPLARAREVRAAGLFRDLVAPERRWPRPTWLAAIFLSALALVGSAVALSGTTNLSLGFLGGLLVALGALAMAARGAKSLSRRMARGKTARGRPTLRLALAAAGGPTGETQGVVLSLGLGLAVLATIGQIDANMRSLIDRELPQDAPAFFFIDIQNDQLDPVMDTITSRSGIERVETAPMLRGIVTKLNGVPAREATITGSGWVIRGDRGVTYSTAPPIGTSIVEGEWWPKDYQGPPLVSFSEEEGRELGLSIGSTVTVNVLGRDITATVASFRVVDFRTMGINFVMVFDPSAFRGAPHTHIATVYAEEETEAPLLRDLARGFPNVTAIRVRDAIARVSEGLEDLAAATRWGAAATLLTGVVVLIGAAAAGQRRQIYEAAVLKTLGATRARILASHAIRAGLLGAAAGLVAVFAGWAAGWAVMTQVMDAKFTFQPVSALAIVTGGALASLLAGLFFALKPLSARPARVLRARD